MIRNTSNEKQTSEVLDSRKTANRVENESKGNSRALAGKRYDLCSEKKDSLLLKRFCEVASDNNPEVEIVISVDTFVNNSHILSDKLNSIGEKLKITIEINTIKELDLFNQLISYDNLSKSFSFVLKHTEMLDFDKIDINDENIEKINIFLENFAKLNPIHLNNLKIVKFGDIILDKFKFIVSQLKVEILEFGKIHAGSIIFSDLPKLTTFLCGDIKTKDISFKGVENLRKIGVGNIEGVFALPDAISGVEEIRTGNIHGIFALPDVMDELVILYVGSIHCTKFTLPKSLNKLKSFTMGTIKNSSKPVSTELPEPTLVLEFPKILDCLENFVADQIRTSWCKLILPEEMPNLKYLELHDGGFTQDFKFPEKALSNLQCLMIREGATYNTSSNTEETDLCKLLKSLDSLTTLTVHGFKQVYMLKSNNSLSNLRNLTLRIIDHVQFGYYGNYTFENEYSNLETITIMSVVLQTEHTFKLSGPVMNLKNLNIDEIKNIGTRIFAKDNRDQDIRIALKLSMPPDSFTNITLREIGAGVKLDFPDSMNNLRSLSFEHIGDNSIIKLPNSMPHLQNFQYGKDDRDFYPQLPLLFIKYQLMLSQNLPAVISGVVIFILIVLRFYQIL